MQKMEVENNDQVLRLVLLFMCHKMIMSRFTHEMQSFNVATR
jgi:hypothetical protein